MREKINKTDRDVCNEASVANSEPIIGIVTDCVKLNVRKEPDIQADIVAVIPFASEVSVDVSDSTFDFYKVVTAAGTEGFCMKKFVNIESTSNLAEALQSAIDKAE